MTEDVNAYRDPDEVWVEPAPGQLPPGELRWVRLVDEQRPPRVGWLWAAVYLCGMTAAAISGSAFVIGGMLAGANGWAAVALAATIPAAAILWVITITLLQRLRVHYNQ